MKGNVVTLRDGSRTIIFEVSELIYAKSSGNYTDLWLTKGIQYSTVRIQIGQLWRLLEETGAPNCLARIDRCTILNGSFVSNIKAKECVVTVSLGHEHVDIHIAKSAIAPLKEKVKDFVADNPKFSGVSVVNRTLWLHQKEDYKEHQGYMFCDLDLTSGTLWAVDDMAEDGPFGPKLFETPYTLVDYEGAEKGSFESYLQEEKELPEAIWGENQPGWRLPTVEEWKELFKECESEWMLTQRNEVVCVLTGKNGKHITFKSLSKQRGFCSYWTGNSEQIGDFIDLDFRNGLVEFAEPYNNELWYHFVLNLDSPESNIRAVISPEVLK